MSYTYVSFQQALALFMALPNAAAWNGVTPSPWPNFDAAVPSIVDYAEQRCYRELDLLNATSSQTVTLVALQSTLDFSTLAPQLIILEEVRLIVPAGTTVPDLGERIPLTPVSTDYIRAVYGSAATADEPEFFALSDDHTLVFGPFPDQAYTAELRGKYRPTPLYDAAPDDGTQTTFLANILPDLFLSAAMISASGYQKNFGSQADNPQQSMSWETQFNLLLASAKTEETRKKFHGWQAMTSDTNPPPTPQPIPGG